MPVNPLTASGLSSSLAAIIKVELAALAADALTLRNMLSPGDVVTAVVLPSNGMMDLLDIGGLRVAAELPPTLLPGETITVQVTGFTGDRINLQILPDASAALAEAQKTSALGSSASSSAARFVQGAASLAASMPGVTRVAPEHLAAIEARIATSRATAPPPAALARSPVTTTAVTTAVANILARAALSEPPDGGIAAARGPTEPVIARPFIALRVPNAAPESRATEAAAPQQAVPDAAPQQAVPDAARPAAPDALQHAAVPDAAQRAPNVMPESTATEASAPQHAAVLNVPQPAVPDGLQRASADALQRAMPNAQQHAAVPIALRQTVPGALRQTVPAAPEQTLPNAVGRAVPSAPAAFAEPAALLRALHLPVTPSTLAAARLALDMPGKLPHALTVLDRALASNIDPHVATLRTLVGFLARLEPDSPVLAAQVAAFVDHVVVGREGKLAQLLQAYAQAADMPAEAASGQPATLAAERVAVGQAAVDYDLKTQLLAVVSGRPDAATAAAGATSPGLAAAVSNALTAVTALQLGSASALAANPDGLTFALPIALPGGFAQARVRIDRDMPQGAAAGLDGDNFHIAFVLDTQNLGTVAIDLVTVGRAVTLDVKTEAAPAQRVFGSALSQLTQRLEALHYRVAKAQAAVAPRGAAAFKPDVAPAGRSGADGRLVDLDA